MIQTVSFPFASLNPLLITYGAPVQVSQQRINAL